MSRPGQVLRDGDTKIFEGGQLLQGASSTHTLKVGRLPFLEMTKDICHFVFRCLDATQFGMSITSDCTEMRSSLESTGL